MTNFELLRTIQDGAVTSEMPVGDLLRRCQILSARLKVPELAAWVRHELDGYPDKNQLPSYRVVQGVAQGHFLGPMGSGLRNASLPASCLPESLRDWAQVVYVCQPISALEETIRKAENNSVRFAWPGDLIALVQDKFYDHLTLGQAWLLVSKGSFVAVVETVRNRILTFALETEKLVTDGGEKHGTEQTPTSGAVLQVFNNVIYGSVGNLGQASHDFAQQYGVQAGDLEGLLRALQVVGVESADASELQTAIANDGSPKQGRIGPRVAGWIGNMMSKAIAGTWRVAAATATTVLPKLIEKYYGLSDAVK